MKHGTAHAYIELKCRCAECKNENRLRAARTRRLKAYGRWETKFVDAAPVREHLTTLQAQGWGAKKIAELSGVPFTSVRHLMYGRSPAEQTWSRQPRPAEITKLLRTNAEKLLALQYSVEASIGGTLVPSLGARRRAETLVFQGYSFNWQAQQLGALLANYKLSLEGEFITAERWHAIKKLYDEHVWTPKVGRTHAERVAISRCKNLARKNNYASPYYWNDIDTDPSKRKGINK